MRYLLVDRYEEIVPGVRGRALKCVTRNDASIASSFEWNASWPPALIIEAMAQVAAAVLVVDTSFEGVYGLVKIEGADFIKSVHAGDTVVFDLQVSERMADCVRFEAKALVYDDLVATAQFFLAAIDSDGFIGKERFHAGWRELLEVQGANACLGKDSKDE